MKLLKNSLLLALFYIVVFSMAGCTSKEIDAKKVINESCVVADMTEFGTIINEIETEIKQKKAEEEAERKKAEAATAQESEAKQKTTTTKQNNASTQSNTNKTTSSKYPYYIKVNRLANCVTIYKQDESGAYTVPVKAMVCSVGKNINNTPTGVFKTSDKYSWRYLFGNQYGQYATRITGHILFHSVPYTSQSKDTLKTDYYNNLGVADSMGCIRLTCEDAKWIYDNCAKGTTVEIYDSSAPGPLGKPTAMKIDVNSPYAGWDPTDPDSANPWKTAKPTISGVSDITTNQGEACDYTSQVAAQDVYGNALQVVLSGSVDWNVAGEYTITYTATDARGNVATKTAVITVMESVESDENTENEENVESGKNSESNENLGKT